MLWNLFSHASQPPVNIDQGVSFFIFATQLLDIPIFISLSDSILSILLLDFFCYFSLTSSTLQDACKYFPYLNKHRMSTNYCSTS